ncbi:MAG: acylphosphatase [Rhodanobacteraceae bacterium]
MPTARFLVSGRVQGVFFRASARSEAQKLDIAGSARNLADGRVEVVASGTDAALDAFGKWLQVGPPAARVAGVVRESVDDGRLYRGFRVE